MIYPMEDVEKMSKSWRRAAKVCLVCRRLKNGDKTDNGLHTIIEAISKMGKEYDMKINFKKAKVMRVYRNGSKRERVFNQNTDRRTIFTSSESVSLFGLNHYETIWLRSNKYVEGNNFT